MTLKVRAGKDLKAQDPLALILPVANVSRSTFYDHRHRLIQADRRAVLEKAIDATFTAANSAYGHRRIRAVLVPQGWQVSKKTVLKFMCELGLQCPVRRRRRYNSFRGDVGQAAANVLNRQIAAKVEHTKWITDVTEFNVGNTKVSLSPVLYLFDRGTISVIAAPSPSL